MSRTARIILSSIVVLVGCIGLCCGVFSGVIFPMLFDSDIARVEGLEPVSYVAVEDGAPGRTVLVEGVISPRNPASAEGFVIYTRYERAAEPGGGGAWREVATEHPPFLLEMAGGLVQVRDGYSISGVTPSAEDGRTRVAGLRAGDAVIVVGALVAGREGVEVAPSMLGVGTREEFLESNRETVLILRYFGWGLLGVGGVIAAGGLALLLLAFRRPNA